MESTFYNTSLLVVGVWTYNRKSYTTVVHRTSITINKSRLVCLFLTIDHTYVFQMSVAYDNYGIYSHNKKINDSYNITVRT